MLNIDIKTQPSNKMRYPTAGDYYEDRYGTHIRVADMGCWEYEALVVAHELVEYFIIKFQGIPIRVIDAWDIQFEKERDMGIHGPDDEPGEGLGCPYAIAHSIASGVERILGAMIGVDFDTYANAFNNLIWNPTRKSKSKKRARK
jgi:hypothetical protein